MKYGYDELVELMKTIKYEEDLDMITINMSSRNGTITTITVMDSDSEEKDEKMD